MKKGYLKSTKYLVLAVLTAFAMIAVPALTEATGRAKLFTVNLANSGSGGAASGSNNIDSFVAGQCGGTYGIDYIVNYGAFNSSSFKFNTSSFTPKNISGYAKGGVGFTGSMDTSAYNLFDPKHSGKYLVSGQKYTYEWNRTIPLGSQKAVTHIFQTIAGLGTDMAFCGTEDEFLFLVGTRSSLLASSIESNREFVANNEALFNSIEGEFVADESSTIDLGHTLVNHYSSHKGEDLIYFIQQENHPVQYNNIPNESFKKEYKHGYDIEVVEVTNEEGLPLTIINFNKGNTYMSITTTLPEEEAVKLLEDL